MSDRIDLKPLLAVIGGALLLISLFLDWFIVPGQPPAIADAPIGNAWAVFESLDLLLAGLAIAVIYAAYEQISGQARLPRGLMLPLGLLALVVVASQLLDPPPGAGTTADPTTGAWLALAGGATMAVGGLLSIAGISFAVTLDGADRPASSGRRRATQDA
ncbi:MAG: hypothetical protein ACRDKH_01525 [Solirubrobacterales bacterium]